MKSSAKMTAKMVPNVWRPQAAKVRNFRLPGDWRVGIAKDPGNGDIFTEHMMHTHLWGHIRNSEGKLIEICDLGSGKITNMGVQALLLDGKMPNTSTAVNQLMANLKWHAWGTGVTAEATTDAKMQTPAAPTATECQEGTFTYTSSGEGTTGNIFKNTSPKITAGGTLAITEWGMFNGKKLENVTSLAEQTANAATASTIGVAGTPFTASTTSVRGEVGYAAQVKTLSAGGGEAYGIITASTTSQLTVQAFYKDSSATLGAVGTPEATSKFTVNPVMFDHRVFTVINLSTGNTIEFPWELTITSGG